MASPRKTAHPIIAESRRMLEERKHVEQIAAVPGSNVVLLPMPEGWGRIASHKAAERRSA